MAMSPEEAAARYEEKVQELNPSAAVAERVAEYRREVERAEHR